MVIQFFVCRPLPAGWIETGRDQIGTGVRGEGDWPTLRQVLGHDGALFVSETGDQLTAQIVMALIIMQLSEQDDVSVAKTLGKRRRRYLFTCGRIDHLSR